VAFLARALEKRIPDKFGGLKRDVELESQFFATLLYHAQLEGSAKACLGVLAAGDELRDPSAPTLVELWRIVQAFRTWLRSQRQAYTKIEEEASERRKGIRISELPDESKSEARPESRRAAGKAPPRVELDGWIKEVVIPESYQSLVSQLRARLTFMASLVPAMSPTVVACSVDAESEAAAALLGARSLGDDALGRADVSSRKWNRVLGVLQAQQSWKGLREDAATLRGKPSVVGQLPSSLSAVAQSCFLYLTEGTTAPPELLAKVFQRRLLRAYDRQLGLGALHRIVSVVRTPSAKHDALVRLREAFDSTIHAARVPKDLPKLRLSPSRSENSGSGSNNNNTADGDEAAPPNNPEHEATAPGAPSSGGGGSSSGMDEAAMGPAARCHYLQGLEGAGGSALKVVKEKFSSLYLVLGDVLRTSLTQRRYDHVLSFLWLLVIDYATHDQDLLARSSILPPMFERVSLSQQVLLSRPHWRSADGWPPP
jgi:hypothetical protein